MAIARLLVANRGEVAIRIMRTARELGIATVAVTPIDDATALHGRMADARATLPGAGAAAYLDAEAVIAAALELGCDAVHPGYGFLAENADFAERCRNSGLTFVGPSPQLLRLFGDKLAARAAADRVGVPVLPGTISSTGVDEARAFLESLGPGGAMVIKAVAGGGGRGMRVVTTGTQVAAAYERCRSEAQSAFGSGALYVERLVRRARHVEVQILGDRSGEVTHLGERDCSIQRRHQKLVEIAPAPFLPDRLRQRVIDAAVRIAADAGYDNVGTFEFLIDAERLGDDAPFAFIEANPRLQVEHTVTEEVHGVDLVELQLRLAGGERLSELRLPAASTTPTRYAIQLRITMERMTADGESIPGSGRIATFELPGGPGVRIDTFGYVGYETSGLYDSLLAKIVASKPGAFENALARAYRALCELRLDGVPTNVRLLQNLLRQPAFTDGEIYTRYVDDHVAELIDEGRVHPALHSMADASELAAAPVQGGGSTDWVSVLTYGESSRADLSRHLMHRTRTDGAVPVEAPMRGVLLSIEVADGATVEAGQVVAIMESMKMEHEIRAPAGGVVRDVAITAKTPVAEGQVLFHVAPVPTAPETTS
jgi:acetyl/propionyl-CoA carboxylase alpha subunit